MDNVFLYDLDDLRAVVSANLERRRGELPAAEQVIAEEVEKYWQWVAGLAAVPVVTQFREEMNRVRERELAAALRRLGDLTPEQRAAVEHFSQSLMNKFLHEPTVRLRAAAANGRGLGVVDAARYLFALDERDATADADVRRRPAPRRIRLMPTALVTGGAGFIGSHVAERFLARRLDGARHRQPRHGQARERSRGRDVSRARHPRRRRRRTLVASAKPDVLVHLAAQMDVRKSVADPCSTRA